MTGKTFTEFMDDLAYNPEMEFMFRGERYMISGYLTRDQYTLELCNIDTDLMLFTMTSASRDECVSAFEKARVFDGQTISEAEHEIGECKIVCVNRYCMNLLYAPYWGKQR